MHLPSSIVSMKPMQKKMERQISRTRLLIKHQSRPLISVKDFRPVSTSLHESFTILLIRREPIHCRNKSSIRKHLSEFPLYAWQHLMTAQTKYQRPILNPSAKVAISTEDRPYQHKSGSIQSCSIVSESLKRTSRTDYDAFGCIV